MAKIHIGVIGQGLPMADKVSRLIRCSDCEYLHENGNCLKVGGFFSSVADKDCVKVGKAYVNKTNSIS
jgi:hypothetical protein